MIPLGSSAGVLPRVPTNGMINGDFPLTIVKPPLLDLGSLTVSSPVNSGTPVIRILQSRSQRRNSSASSLQSFVAAHTRRKEVEAFGNNCGPTLKDNGNFATTNIIKTQKPDLEAGCLQGQKRVLSACNVPSKETREETIQKSESTNCLQTKSTEIHINSLNNPQANGSNESSCDETKNINKTHRTKTGIKSSKKNRKKQTKSGKSIRKKSSKKGSTKKGCVFNRLSSPHKGEATQEHESAHERNRRNSSSMIFSNTNGNILSISKLHTAYMPSRTPKRVIYLPKVPVKPNPVQIINSQNSPRKEKIEETTDIAPSPRKVLGWSSDDNGRVSLRKVYLSEVQSRMLGGAPSAPPGTPTSDQLKRVEYIPSLFDIKSQRLVKAKLEKIELKVKMDEQKKKEKAMKEEQKKNSESIVKLKQRQREEIYALNKVMTQLENENFRKFMKEKDTDSLPV